MAKPTYPRRGHRKQSSRYRVSALANGVSASNPAPMPLNNKSGVRVEAPGQMPTRNRYPWIRNVCTRIGRENRDNVSCSSAPSSDIASDFVKNINSERISDWWVFRIPQRGRCKNPFARSLAKPDRAIVPPHAYLLGRSVQPLLRRCRSRRIGEIAGFRIPRRADQRLNVARTA